MNLKFKFKQLQLPLRPRLATKSTTPIKGVFQFRRGAKFLYKENFSFVIDDGKWFSFLFSSLSLSNDDEVLPRFRHKFRQSFCSNFPAIVSEVLSVRVSQRLFQTFTQIDCPGFGSLIVFDVPINFYLLSTCRKFM